MNKYLLSFILTLPILSCQKDDDAITTPKKDYSSFLATTSQTFQGSLDRNSFSWTYGWNQFQGIAGFENGNGICDSTDPARVVLFGLTSEGRGQTRFRLYSPKYNATSKEEINNIFSVGKKKLGDFRTDFYLSINIDNRFYQSSNNPTNNIEILKTEVFSTYLGEKLRVWFIIDAKLSAFNCQNSTVVLADGILVAEFWGVKKEH